MVLQFLHSSFSSLISNLFSGSSVDSKGSESELTSSIIGVGLGVEKGERSIVSFNLSFDTSFILSFVLGKIFSLLELGTILFNFVLSLVIALDSLSIKIFFSLENIALDLEILITFFLRYIDYDI
ncbi:hypothetical protein SDC9_154454 [bioreactor metagenome]|uniref:Uncharacterized protein n=1 Tax=bioreactor metagenome TaxID=1076179 RepID=A0A645EYQ2_9ZZZZ